MTESRSIVRLLIFNESTPKTLQIQKCFFWRYFNFSQSADTQASPNFKKRKSHPKKFIL
jgi:hypothetical protein